ncbi:MAG: hypothetical protein Q8P17_00260 [bacterium]|nr:hypothetical protein [bacterium]
MEFVQKYELTKPEVTLLAEMIGTHQLSVPYVGGLLRNGIKLPYIHAAYVLRDEIPPLYDPNSSRGGRKSEFVLPIEKICRLLTRLYHQEEVDDDESIEAAIRLLHEVADRCPSIDTWSSVLDILLDQTLDTILQMIASREGDMLDLPPMEKVEAMIVVIDEFRIIDGRRF